MERAPSKGWRWKRTRHSQPTHLHTSIAAKSRWFQWQEQGLYLCQLPKYSSQMNPIETEWHQLKTHELVGRIFEDEYELALAVINGVEARAQRKYNTERFLFNSA